VSAESRPSTRDEILAHLVEERLEGLASKFGNDALAWLAVTPTWTEPAASAASFPSHDTPLAQFLEEASDQGLVDRDPPLRSDPELGRAFWIAENDRGPVLDYLRRQKAFGAAKLTEVTVQIARRLEEVQASTPLPDELRYWSDLAKRAREPFDVARQLGDDVTALTRDKKTGEALGRVDAVRSLAQTLGTTHLDAAIGVGSRRIGLAYRQAADDRHLKRYFPRDEQHQAFAALLEPGSRAWALHYLGVGGAGKTMLMRWITTPRNADGTPGPERVVSRIDFDDLNPEYPVRKPGQLLLDLAVELRRFGRSTQEESLFKAVNDTVQDLHALLSVAPPPSDPLFNVERPEFERILRPFCDLVAVLPPPVVLILDTCEELARVPVVQGILPSIEATFRILERVHERVPTAVRVIFSGRRPIASSGHLWKLRDAGNLEDRGFRQFLKQKPYLALHEVRGVTSTEAHAFLEARVGRPIPQDLEDLVCARSLDPGRAADVVVIHKGTPPASDGQRYSLFDLALYGDWLREDPTLDAARIASGTSDPYVDLRIVQRVKQPAIRAALPAIAALGRFDAPMLRGAFPSALTDDAYADVYRQLGDYEWLELQRESGTDKLFLEVDRNLLPRIRSYYDQPARRSEAARVSAGLAPGLSSLLRRTRLGDLSATHLSAALAILPAASAARLWIEVLLRVRPQADLNWLRTTTERLMGVDSETARHGPLQRGLDLAATAVALLSGSVRSRAPREIAQPGWPDEDTASWIARCNEAIRPNRTDALDELLTKFRFIPKTADLVPGPDRCPDEVLARRMSEEEAAAIVRAIEHRAEVLPPPSRLEPRFQGVEEFATAVGEWATQLKSHDYPAELVGMAQMLAARLWAVAWNIGAATVWSAMALETANSIDSQSGGVWLFWRSPEAPCDRIRHELLRLHEDAGLLSAPDPTAWLAGALSRSASIDGERLASAIERRLLDRELPEPTELGISEVADTYVRERQPLTRAQRSTPPLFVTLAMKRAALGDFEKADAALQTRALVAEKEGDPETVWTATLARVDVACRSREMPRDLASVVARLPRDAKDLASARDVYAMKALLGVDVTEGFDGSGHDRWRATAAQTPERAAVELDAFNSRWRADAVDGARLTLEYALDGVEAERLGSRHDRVLTYRRPVVPVFVGIGEELLRDTLRLYALDPIPDDQLADRVQISLPLRALLPDPPDGPDAGVVHRGDLVRLVDELVMNIDRNRPSGAPFVPAGASQRLIEHFGLRRCAAVAQEEGELLALRLPREGVRLLELAEKLAGLAGDPHTAMAAATTASLFQVSDVRERDAAVLQRVRNTWVSARGEESWGLIEKLAADIAGASTPGASGARPPLIPGRDGWVPRAALTILARTVRDDAEKWVRAGVNLVRIFPDAGRAPEVLSVLAATDGVLQKDARVEAADAPAPAPDRPAWLRVGVTTAFALALVALWVYGVRINLFGETGTPTPDSTPFLFPLLGLAGTLAAVGLVAGDYNTRIIIASTALLFVMSCSTYWFIGTTLDVLLPDSVVPGRLTQSWRVVAMVVVIFGFTALGPLVQRARAAVARGSDAWISVGSSSSRGDLRTELGGTSSLQLHVTCTPRVMRLPFAAEPSERRWTGTVEISALQPYAETSAQSGMGDAIGPLAEIRPLLRGLVWPVPLDTGAAAYHPWEGILGLALSQSATLPPDAREPVFFYRWGPPRPRSDKPDAWSTGHVQVLGTAASDVWVDRVTPRPPVNWLNIGSPMREPAYTIVHAVGTPVLTSYGPRLDLADKSGFLDAHHLPADLPLLVLQQQPTESQARVTTDREQAALLREVAADLFESTCDAVIVIPPLPPALADNLVKGLARELSAGRFGFDRLDRWLLPDSEPRRGRLALVRLATAVRAARALVLPLNEARGGPMSIGDRPDAGEVAWDFCLFARPRDPGGEMHIGR